MDQSDGSFTCVKPTGKLSIAKLICKSKRNRRTKLSQQIQGRESDERNDKIPKKENDHMKLKNEAVETSPIIFNSYGGLFLLSDHKQVFFEKNYFANVSPMKSMYVVSFDYYPLQLEENECLIQIEFSTVSHIDCALRRNKCYDKQLKQPNIPGFCAIGRIIAFPNNKNGENNVPVFKIGDRIATILFKGGNARFAKQRSSRILKIEEEDNGTMICELLCASTAAFACLQHFVPNIKRYDSTSHFGETILVHGGMSPVGQALIRLSHCLGATKVYASGSPNDFKLLKNIGAIPLPMHLQDNNSAIVEQFDTIIDCTSLDDLEHLQRTRKKCGRIVFYEYGDTSMSGYGWRSDLHRLFLKCKLLPFYNYASFCDPWQELFLDDFERFKTDFEFLKAMMLMDKKMNRFNLCSQITIPLDKVPLSHLKIDKHKERGIIIVDPWK